jgi:hypothetical protein
MAFYIKKASNNYSPNLMQTKKAKWHLYEEDGKVHIYYKDGKKEEGIIWFEPLNTNAKKTFNFLLQKANQQHYPEAIEFNLENYMDYIGTSSKDYAFRQLKKDTDIVSSIIVKAYRKGKKSYDWDNELPFAKGKITYNKCNVKCNAEIVKNVFCQYYTILPTWIGRLNGKAYELADYIFYLARQKENKEKIITKGYFTIRQQSVIDNLKLPKEDKIHYKQLVIVPIQKAVEDINNYEDNIDDIKIEPTKNNIETLYKITIKKEITGIMFPKKYYADKKENS